MNKPDRATMHPDCVFACIDYVTYMERQMDEHTDETTKYYLEHMFVGKHCGPYLCLKQKIHIKTGEILKLLQISELMPPTAFLYLNLFRNDK